jgi:hypothetical protein
LFITYVTVENPGTTPISGYGEEKTFTVSEAPGPGGSDVPTDQWYNFGTAKTSADGTITIQGWYPINEDYGEGVDNSKPRSFIVSESEGKKGICIELYNDEGLAFQAFIFNQGQIKWTSQSNNYGVTFEGLTVVSKSSGGMYMQEKPLISKTDNTLHISIVQTQISSSFSVGDAGSSTCRLVTKLVDDSIRVKRSPESFSIQVYAPNNDGSEKTWIDYLKTLGFTEDATDANFLVYATPPKIIIHHTIFSTSLQGVR